MPETYPINKFQTPEDWFDLTYLLHGSASQQAAYQALLELQIFSRLKAHNPVLAGTIPLQLNVLASDLDILCEIYDQDEFVHCLSRHFGRMQGYNIVKKSHQALPTVVGSFDSPIFPIEVFGQPLPVHKQRAFQHMLIEARLLDIGGSAAHQVILKMKKVGMKTEPAFAKYFNLPGDPYQTLLDMMKLTTSQLEEFLAIYGWAGNLQVANV